MEFSQEVKANNASIVLSGEIPAGKWTRISTSAAVLSSIFLILILLFSLALRMESISEEVVVPNGTSVITSVFLLSCDILALQRTLPPRNPSL